MEKKKKKRKNYGGRSRKSYEKKQKEQELFRPEEEAPVTEEQKGQLLELFGHQTYKPMRVKELAILLGVPKEERFRLQAALDALLSEGRIGISKRGKYALADKFYITGTFLGNRKGFGFVVRDEENPDAEKKPDIFIPAEHVNSAMDGDRVQVSMLYGKKYGKKANPEGRVANVLERAHKTVVATYEKAKGFGFAVPVSKKLCQDIFIPAGAAFGASDRDRVMVEFTDYGGAGKKPEGRVTEVLGQTGAPGVDILSIAKSYGFESEFPEAVERELQNIPDQVEEVDMKGRRDLRGLQTVTIDGEDAKDLDDAITLEKRDGHYFLGVHIADVSHYVREGSALDKEALSRGTSVYLTDRVIPMLPKKLSNGICSLNQGVPRLALSCLVELDEKGKVLEHEIAKTVICVDRRMTYTAVNAVLEGDVALTEEYKEFAPFFFRMKELSDILRKRRKKRGSIDFEFAESKIVLDEDGRPVDIHPYERNAATMLIEDFMLLANETVAEDYFWQGQPFVYRVHENPDPDRIRELALFISNFGYHLKMGKEEIHPGELQRLLAKIQDSPEEAMLSRLTLRSMKRAKYQTECIGHFGLAAKYYCHFTSPIRRYPDLQIHRIIGECLAGRMSGERKEHYQELLGGVCAQCSLKERQADDAERETEKLKKCEYMASRIGEVYDGVISGVTGWGMYVELPNTVEGMISLSALDNDYYEFDEAGYRLVGHSTGRVYRLGQKLRIRVTAVDTEACTIDFAPEQDLEADHGEGQL